MRKFYLYTERPVQNIIKEIFIGFEIHVISKEDIKKNNFSYKNILFILNESLSVNINDISIFIKIYLYILLKVKKSNFIKNILSIYIYFCIFNILKKIYRESERILLYPYIIIRLY